MEEPYVDIAKTIERLHRRFLDVVRAELNRRGYRDLSAVQAMLLTNIGDEEIVIRDLIERGYYQGSNVSYNLKKLVEGGYIQQKPSKHDKRSMQIKLTDKSKEVCEIISALELKNAELLAEEGIDKNALETTHKTLRRLERIWSDFISFGR